MPLKEDLIPGSRIVHSQVVIRRLQLKICLTLAPAAAASSRMCLQCELVSHFVAVGVDAASAKAGGPETLSQISLYDIMYLGQITNVINIKTIHTLELSACRLSSQMILSTQSCHINVRPAYSH